MEEASNELGETFAKVYASYDSEDGIKGRSEVEDEAFRILVSSSHFFLLCASTNLLH